MFAYFRFILFEVTKFILLFLGEGERHWLRLLLHHIRGATSFEDVRTVEVDGIKVLCSTFKEAAIKLGLLEDDNEIFSCLQECANIRSGRSLRQLFAIILVFHEPRHPQKAWNTFLAPLTEDLLHSKRQVLFYFFIYKCLDLNIKNIFCYDNWIFTYHVKFVLCRNLEWQMPFWMILLSTWLWERLTFSCKVMARDLPIFLICLNSTYLLQVTFDYF